MLRRLPSLVRASSQPALRPAASLSDHGHVELVVNAPADKLVVDEPAGVVAVPAWRQHWDRQLASEAVQREGALADYLSGLRKAKLEGEYEFEPLRTATVFGAHKLDAVLEQWAADLSAAIAAHREKPSQKQMYGALARAKAVLPPHAIAGIAIKEMCSMLTALPECMPVLVASMRVGSAVLAAQAAAAAAALATDNVLMDASASLLPAAASDEDTEAAVALGSAVLALLVRNTHISTDSENAFRHGHQLDMGRNKRTGVLIPHDAVSRLFAEGAYSKSSFLALRPSDYAPMETPPRSFGDDLRSGGYLLQRKRGWGMIGRPCALQRKALAKADLRAVVRGLDALGSVAWRVNDDVWQLLADVHDAAVPFGKMPAENIVALVDQRSALRRKEREAAEGLLTREEVKERKRKLELDLAAVQAKVSRRSTFSLVLQATSKMANRSNALYFPYNMDFRGRVYPLSPAVSHTGEDTARGLLGFAQPKPLGERGLFWLKVHLANQLGHDKVSLDDRAAWVDEHMDEVVRSVEQPLVPNDLQRRLWNQGGKPAQAYAAALEIARAVRTGNPASYLSSLPVHQDGSCNGLQHYAALGRDLVGGAKVNLVPRDKPADVYSEIAAIVRAQVLKTAATYDASRLADDLGLGARPKYFAKDRLPGLLAHLLTPHVTGKMSRKIVKQTVMTSVYGVTLLGARDQIERQLLALNDDAKRMERNGGPLLDYIDDRFVGAAGMYLAKLTMDTIKGEFVSAKEIMEWLQHLARVAASENGQLVSWVTPLGLPVVQPYRKHNARLVRTALQKVFVSSERSENGPVHASKQRTALAPNYVHSLDSTHMLMTATACQERGIAFAAVHDSFWTHAGTVDAMNAILREQFVRLHSRDLLGELHEQFKARYPLSRVAPPPKKGALDLKSVLESQYFFA